MTRRILCVLSLILIATHFSAKKVEAFSFSIFPFGMLESKTVESVSEVKASDAEDNIAPSAEDIVSATESAALSDTFLNEYFPSVSADSVGTAVSPLSVGVVKGISTYFTSWHPGIDIRADQGSTIHAIKDGVVVENAYQAGGYGKYIVIEHMEGHVTVRSLYAHMKSTLVSVGDTVRGKDVIGYVGMTGHTTGPHIHLETRVCPEGTEFYLCSAIDPIRYITKGLPAYLAKK